MKNYFLSLVISGIVVSLAFSQCTSPTTSNTEETTQTDPDLTLKINEPKSIEEPTPYNNPTPIDKPIPINKPIPVEKPKPIDKPTSTNKSIPIEKAQTIDEPITINKPKSVDEPVSLKSSGFTLKVLKATIKGTSTLHDWESQVTEIEGKGAFQLKDKVLAAIQNAEIKIAVEGIKSTEGKKMDSKTYETFKSNDHPFIVYAFSNAVINISAAHVVTIKVDGKLSMAGSSKSVSLSANGTELPNGDLRLTVSEKIKMTDYNMEPPVMFLGTIKVGDEITVSFDFELTKVNNSN